MVANVIFFLIFYFSQPLMPPFATPYAAIYPHGVYSHPSVSLVSVHGIIFISSFSCRFYLESKLAIICYFSNDWEHYGYLWL